MKPTNLPTHEAITRRAQKIWNIRGNPIGLDTAIWIEAERQLTDASRESPGPGPTESPVLPGLSGQGLAAAKDATAHGEAKQPAPHLSESAAAAPDPIEITAKAATQKKSAKAPRLPTHQNAPKQAPTESGKPLWNQPHSS
jgi:hypothetical protein